jgi:hypothetical protein
MLIKSVLCIAASRNKAEQILNRLRSEGFYSNDISVLFPAMEGSRDFAPEGAANGARTGGLLGGALGWLVGIGALAIPGVGPLIVAGPIVATLSGAAVGAADGGITGTLIGMGIPEYEAKRYEGKVKAGHILLSVRAQSWADAERAKEIFEATGAQDIATSAGRSAPKPKDRAPQLDPPPTGSFRIWPGSAQAR